MAGVLPDSAALGSEHNNGKCFTSNLRLDVGYEKPEYFSESREDDFEVFIRCDGIQFADK